MTLFVLIETGAAVGAVVVVYLAYLLLSSLASRTYF
jgi:hypothetical protein